MLRQPLSVALRLALCAVLLLASVPAGATPATPRDIYADTLAPGWSDWSWATVNLQVTSPVHSGTYSIGVNAGAWEGLYLHHAGVLTSGFTWLRFFVHGGSAGGQLVQVYVERASGGSGPTVALPPLAANTWTELRVPLADLGAADTTITGIVWQDRSGGTQPAFYVDDITLAANEDPNGPVLSAGRLRPRALPADGATLAVVRVTVGDPQGLGDIAGVTLDASALGRGTLTLRDDGRSNDGAAGDGVYGGLLGAAAGTPAGERLLLVTAQDQAGHRASLQLGAVEVLAAPGGSVPAALAQRMGYGTSEWSEVSGQDWQVNSGVPWNYDYQYITYDWWVNGWGGDFVGRFTRHAWQYQYVPVVSVYMFLGMPPNCGEDPVCYAQKLQNAATVSEYLTALHEAADQARGTSPVIFQLEPDFYGYMQQLSNSQNPPPGVRPDDPSSYPVALNIAGYPNNLAGFGRRMVDVIHATAPNALVAPHASMWATNYDPNLVTANEVPALATRTAAFIDAMGGAQADLFFVEWSDRDAGSGLRPWWDDTDNDLPRPSRALLWADLLSAAAGKRLILWQVPAGNMSLDDTCNRYRDNRVAYFFNHPRDLVDSGITAVLVGPGATCMTRASTDGGFMAAQGAIAYAMPAAPSGLTAGAPAGLVVPLVWNENTEPDLYGYRVSYQPLAGGAWTVLDVSRANSVRLALPAAGSWRVRLVAYDAMGSVSAPSASVTVTVGAAPGRVALPLIRR
jgi:hypothetical protein